MSTLLPLLVAGISTGSVYAVAGMGLTLTYKTSGIFNFAQGAIAAAAAYLFFVLRVEHGMPWPLAFAITLLVFGVIGGLGVWVGSRAPGGVPVRAAGGAPGGLVLRARGGALRA